MKLLRCKRCGVHYNATDIKIELWMYASLRDDGKWYYAGEDRFEVYERAFDALDIDLNCPECDHIDKDTLEWVEVDACPHNWDVLGWSNERRCRLCGKRERGEVQW